MWWIRKSKVKPYNGGLLPKDPLDRLRLLRKIREWVQQDIDAARRAADDAGMR